MIKKYLKSSILFGAALLMGAGCTGDFEKMNTNPFQIPDKDVKMSDLSTRLNSLSSTTNQTVTTSIS